MNTQHHRVERAGKCHANVIEWTSAPTPRPRLAVVPPRKPSLTDRIAAAAWRLHDGMPLVWGLMAAIVLLASTGITVALTAMALGWKP